MLFRNIFKNNSIRYILDKTLRLMLFGIDNFLKNRCNFAAVGVYVLISMRIPNTQYIYIALELAPELATSHP